METLRGELQHVQTQTTLRLGDVSLIDREKSLLQELEKWSKIEEAIWKQKSRATWIQLGDSNTKFFQSYAKERLNQNAIKLLVKDDGTKLNTQHLIKVAFYKALMASSATYLPMLDRSILYSGERTSVGQHGSESALFPSECR